MKIIKQELDKIPLGYILHQELYVFANCPDHFAAAKEWIWNVQHIYQATAKVFITLTFYDIICWHI